MSVWSSEQYLKFKDERTQPAIDLARRIAHPAPKRILDIGCGPGNSTGVLARQFPNAHILGIDSSPDMIAAARTGYPGFEFAVRDAGRELASLGGGFDIVFSNACIQWIPDHERLVGSMLSQLAPGGVLAVQIPMNHEEPIHKIIREVSESGGWKASLAGLRVFHTLAAGQYFDLLSEMAAGFSIWETTYYHVLKSHGDIMEWYRGTGLRPYLEALPDGARQEFEKDVFERVVGSYPPQKNGMVIFRFPRFFFTANALND